MQPAKNKARHILIKTKDKAELEDSSASAEKVKIEIF